tara:strand:+ start:618 stop:887 length:270 start_codon:yes stop_codon:yes gene_type:complete
MPYVPAPVIEKLCARLLNMDVISSQIALEDFVSTKCKKVAVSKSGWDTLYIEKENCCYWIKSYPDGALHGGQPILTKINKTLAKEQFDV